MLEDFFIGLPLPLNIVLIFAALYVVIRSSHYLVDGAVHIAHEFRISPLVIGATVVAMGTTTAELAVNLVIVRTDTLREQIEAVGMAEEVSLIILGSPTSTSSPFQRQALSALATEVEKATNIPALDLSNPRTVLRPKVSAN